MALNTYKTFLMRNNGTGSSAVWEKVIDIKDTPDLGSDPNLLQTTTLSDKQHTNIFGLLGADALQFTCNYTLSDYTTVKALEGTEYEWAVWYGGTENGGVVTPNGSDGKFEFKGELVCYPLGASVDAVREFRISIATSTPITLAS